MMCLASFDFLPNYGFEFYPPGFIFSLIFALLVSYAIVKHELLDIKIVIRKSVIYSFLIALITISYLLIVLFFEKVTKNILGYTSPNLSIFTAFIVGIFVIPLKGWLQNILDNAFFKGTAIEIAEENASLRHAVTQTEKLRAVATLASGLAHEIRNPLTTIATFAEYLPSKKDDPEFLAKCHQTLIHETKRVNDLLSELLVFAKPSPPTFQVINPNKLIEDILLLSSHQCEQNNIQIKKNLTTNLNIQADPNQLKQALLNIIFNAVDAMPNGGTLTIETSLKDAYCVISIHDTGPGINPKDLKQIFDPFFTKKEKGTGLGLAITHGIIEQHTGKIVVKSDIRFGTKFIIYLSAEKIQ